MIMSKAIVGSEDSLQLLFGNIETKGGGWILHEGLWIYKVQPGAVLKYNEFPSVNMAVICENVSLELKLLSLFLLLHES